MQISLGLPDSRCSLCWKESRLVLAEWDCTKVYHPKSGYQKPQSWWVSWKQHYKSHPTQTKQQCAAPPSLGSSSLGELLMDAPSPYLIHICIWRGEMWQLMINWTQTWVKIHLKQSKTDQFGKGCDVILGKTNVELCPVAAILDLISRQGNQPGSIFIDSKSKPRKSQFIRNLRAHFWSTGDIT